MERKLGISIYPEKTDKARVLKYIDDASKCGFSRIFSNLISITKPKEDVILEYREINDYAKEKGFEVILDVSPSVFKEFDISYDDLTFFKDMGAHGIRLDIGFTGFEESVMTFNKQDLIIELNMSSATRQIDNIMDYKPNKYNLIGCHNFYPHRYTGLEVNFFKECYERFSKYGLRTAAFISSQENNTFGPWPVTDGLPTLEMHRDIPLDIQLKHLIALGTIDDIIISNCYPSQDELEAVKKVNKYAVNFSIEVIDNLPEIESKILFEEIHFNRPDAGENVIRSTQSRIKYKGNKFELINPKEIIRRGDIVIESSKYGHYAGELQIALKDIKNSGKSSVVGRIVEEELFILDYINPCQKFFLTKK